MAEENKERNYEERKTASEDKEEKEECNASRDPLGVGHGKGVSSTTRE